MRVYIGIVVGLIIYSGDMNMTDWFYGSANASYRSASLMLSKENGTLRASFPSGEFSLSMFLFILEVFMSVFIA